MTLMETETSTTDGIVADCKIDAAVTKQARPHMAALLPLGGGTVP